MTDPFDAIPSFGEFAARTPSFGAPPAGDPFDAIPDFGTVLSTLEARRRRTAELQAGGGMPAAPPVPTGLGAQFEAGAAQAGGDIAFGIPRAALETIAGAYDPERDLAALAPLADAARRGAGYFAGRQAEVAEGVEGMAPPPDGLLEHAARAAPGSAAIMAPFLLGPAAGVAGAYAQTYSGSLNDALDRGVAPGEAIPNAAVSAAVQAGIESIGGPEGALLARTATQGLRQFFSKVATDALKEGGEEVAQLATDYLARAELGEFEGVDPMEVVGRFADEAAIAGPVGVILGGGMSAPIRARDARRGVLEGRADDARRAEFVDELNQGVEDDEAGLYRLARRREEANRRQQMAEAVAAREAAATSPEAGPVDLGPVTLDEATKDWIAGATVAAPEPAAAAPGVGPSEPIEAPGAAQSAEADPFDAIPEAPGNLVFHGGAPVTEFPEAPNPGGMNARAAGHHFASAREVADYYGTRGGEREGTTTAARIPPVEQFLRWDAPLSEQSPAVRAAVERLGIEAAPEDTGEVIYNRAAEAFGSPEAASTAFDQAGVAGAVYLDPNQRFVADGADQAPNFIVFNGKRAKVEPEAVPAEPAGPPAWRQVLEAVSDGKPTRRKLAELSRTVHVEADQAEATWRAGFVLDPTKPDDVTWVRDLDEPMRDGDSSQAAAKRIVSRMVAEAGGRQQAAPVGPRPVAPAAPEPDPTPAANREEIAAVGERIAKYEARVAELNALERRGYQAGKSPSGAPIYRQYARGSRAWKRNIRDPRADLRRAIAALKRERDVLIYGPEITEKRRAAGRAGFEARQKNQVARDEQEFQEGRQDGREAFLAGAAEGDNPWRSEMGSAGWDAGFEEARTEADARRQPGDDELEAEEAVAAVGADDDIPFDREVPRGRSDEFVYADIQYAKDPPEVAKLRRAAATVLHPDKATDPADRDRRTAFMSAANDAADRRELGRVKAILEAFERGDAEPPARFGSRPTSSPPPRSPRQPPPPRPPRAGQDAGADEMPPEVEVGRSVDTEPTKLKIGMPEVVELLERVATALGHPTYASVVKTIRAGGGMARGAFHRGSRRIELLASIFEDPKGAARTFAHEVGHYIDSIPDTILRGNILGSLGSLFKYGKSLIDEVPTNPSRVLTADERKALWREAKKRHPRDTEAARRAYRAMLQREIEERRLVDRGTIMRELKALTQAWNPIPDGAPAEYVKYRHSARELYADAFSVLLNDPELLKRTAPTFHSLFFNHLGAKPDARDAYLDLQRRFGEGDAAVDEARERRVEQMRAEGEQAQAESMLSGDRKATWRETVDEVMQRLVDSNHALYRLRNRARKAGGRAAELGAKAVRAVEELALGNSASLHYFSEFQRRVLEPLHQAGVKPKEAAALLFYARVSGERSKLANPLGIDKEAADRLRDRLRERLGAKAYRDLEAAIADWRENVRKPLLERLISSGAVSRELAEKMLGNPNYARFEVVKYLRDPEMAQASGLSSLRSQVGTFARIGDPLVATVMHDLALQRLADRAIAARAVADFAREMGEATDAKRRWNGRGLSPVEPFEKDKGLIRYMQDGKVVGVVVPAGVAHTFERDPGELRALASLASKFNSAVRMVLVTHNPGFSVWNIQRDLRAFFKNTPGWNPILRARVIASSALDIARSMASGKLSERELEMLKHRAIYAPGRAVWDAGTAEEGAAFEILAEKLGAVDEAHRPSARGALSKLWHRLGRIASALTEHSERTTKLAGWKYLERIAPEMAVEERAEMVRNRVGTPNTQRRGDAFKLYNNLWLFSNVAKEGVRQSYTAARENPLEYALKTVAIDVAPALVAALAARGLLSDDDELEKLFEAIPEHDKSNYTIVPIGWSGAKAVYSRLPHDHAGQFIHALTWKIAMGRLDSGDLLDLASSLMPWGGDNLTPYLTAGGYVLDYARGQNPVDSFRNRPILTQREFEASKDGGQGASRATAKVAKYAWNEIGSSLYRFNTDSHRGIVSELESMLKIPLAGSFLARGVKVSDRGLYEVEQRKLETHRATKANTGLERDDAITDILRRHPKRSWEQIRDDLRRQGVEHGYKREGDLKRRVEQLRVYVAGSRRERLLSLGRSKEERELLDARD